MHHARTDAPRRASARRALRHRHALLAAFLLAALSACADDPLPSGPEALARSQPQANVTAEGASNTWASKVSMPTARNGLVAATVNNGVYAIGGFSSGGGTSAAVESYHEIRLPDRPQPLTIWLNKAPLPEARRLPSGAAVLNGKIYVPGGQTSDGVATKSLFVYDPAAGPDGTWTRKADLPVASFGGVAAAINGKLYVFTPGVGGATGRLDRYDPATNTWTPRALHPDNQIGGAGGAINGKFYVAGGRGRSGFLTAALYVYDPVANLWTTKVPMPTSRAFAAGRVLNGKLYIVGGFNTTNSVLRTVEVYDPATNTWATKADMPTARYGLAAAVRKGVLHAVGGIGNNAAVLAKHEAYTP